VFLNCIQKRTVRMGSFNAGNDVSGFAENVIEGIVKKF
jgi:hypothetical protein